MVTRRKKTKEQFGWLGEKESKGYREYWEKGGALGFNAWMREGKPPPPMQVEMSKEQALARYATAQAAGKEREQKQGEEEAKQAFESERAWEKSKWEREFAEKQRQFGETQKMRQAESGVKMYSKYGINRYDDPNTPEEEGQFNPNTGQWEPPAGWMSPEKRGELGLAEQRARGEEEYRRSQIGLQREQMGQETQRWQQQLQFQQEQSQMQQQEQERQYRSQLMANPMSWLQYSAYTNETPVVQPWQVPLGQGLQAGQALPGWGQGQGQPMGSLPQLTSPSSQYWSRMGPTAQQQYMGYEQTRTGARPEETQFRLGAGSAPSGRYGGVRWLR